MASKVGKRKERGKERNERRGARWSGGGGAELVPWWFRRVVERHAV